MLSVWVRLGKSENINDVQFSDSAPAVTGKMQFIQNVYKWNWHVVFPPYADIANETSDTLNICQSLQSTNSLMIRNPNYSRRDPQGVIWIQSTSSQYISPKSILKPLSSLCSFRSDFFGGKFLFGFNTPFSLSSLFSHCKDIGWSV
jgi:hypothetical protein